MSVVLDASAVIALLEGERGADVVAARLSGAKLCAVNLAEVISIYNYRGVSSKQLDAMFAPLKLDVIAADAGLARLAGALRPITAPAGLSLGDRFCLALALRDGCPALTADRQWTQIAEAVEVEIVVVR